MPQNVPRLSLHLYPCTLYTYSCFSIKDRNTSIYIYNLYVQRKRFPSSLQDICLCTGMLNSTVRRENKGKCRGETEGLAMAERGKQVCYALMMQGAATL